MTLPKTRDQRKQATAERLIRAAHRRFSRHGIAATRMTDVAAAAGVAHGTAFLHFPTREHLVAAVIKHHAGRIALRLHDLAGGGADVRTVLSAHLAGLAEDEPFYARLVLEGPLLGEPARTTLLGIQSAVSIHMAAAAERAIAAGRMRSMPISFLFNLWIGLVHHHLAQRDLFSPGGSVLADRGPSLIDEFLRLLTIQPSEN